ncbi:unnamed protein product [Peniophora sp. CBMAI 1063]|nr:unnamed protein product [Peniophora sp. CBMAI 1063]
MATPKTWKSPLTGYENAEPLPDTRHEDGKSFNPPAPLSKAYESVTEPTLPMSKNGFAFHIYFMQSKPSEVKYAHELHERIRREFPELRIYQVWEKPVGT